MSVLLVFDLLLEYRDSVSEVFSLTNIEAFTFRAYDGRHFHVSEHLNICNGGNFKICPIYNCYNNTRLSRESKEKEIISILKPDLKLRTQLFSSL